MKERPTRDEFEAASSICFAVQQQFVEKARLYEASAKEKTDQEKESLQEGAEQARKRSMFYLMQRLRAGEGAYIPEGKEPSDESIKAYERAVTCYVRSLTTNKPIPPQP